MMRVCSFVAVLSLAAGSALAQPAALERVIPPLGSGHPWVAAPTDPVHFSAVIARISMTGKVPLGLEVATPAPAAAKEMARSTLMSRAAREERQHLVTLSGLTVRQALDGVMKLTPGYAWRDVAGVVVVRPTGAWDAVDDCLRGPAGSFTTQYQTPSEALAQVVRFLAPQEVVKTGAAEVGKPFSVTIQDGTVFDVLNAVVRAHGEMMWQLSTAPGGANAAERPIRLTLRPFAGTTVTHVFRPSV
jgi:hypothetical protein